MPRYANRSGCSGVLAYEMGRDHIDVTFAGGTTYRYGRSNPGIRHVGRMKELARAGRGLATYISTRVREGYEACWPDR